MVWMVDETIREDRLLSCARCLSAVVYRELRDVTFVFMMERRA